MKIETTEKSLRNEVDFDNLVFGKHFADHMFNMTFNEGDWNGGVIKPFQKIDVWPSMCSIHYGQAVFEGMKAYYNQDGKISLFRPKKYLNRLNRSSERLCIPEVNPDQVLEGILKLLELDREWVPQAKNSSLYIRPFIFAADSFLGVDVAKHYELFVISSPVGAYYKTGLKPVNLITSGEFVRAVKGGLGEAKTPANYAASLMAARDAHKKGFSQVLWLDGKTGKNVEEVGTMNVFFRINDTLVTPVLNGSILDGVMRDSVIQLAKEWGMKVEERTLSIDELIDASKSGELKDAFGTGTAAVISPIGEIVHNDETIIVNNKQTGELAERILQTITAIQYGHGEDPFNWMYYL